MRPKEEECDTAASPIHRWANQHASIIPADPPPDPQAHLPWYRTVLRGSGFKLNASDRPHAASRTSSRAVFPPTAAIPGIERQIWGSISSLAGLRRAALWLVACGGRGGKSTHLQEAGAHSPHQPSCSAEDAHAFVITPPPHTHIPHPDNTDYETQRAYQKLQ